MVKNGRASVVTHKAVAQAVALTSAREGHTALRRATATATLSFTRNKASQSSAAVQASCSVLACLGLSLKESFPSLFYSRFSNPPHGLLHWVCSLHNGYHCSTGVHCVLWSCRPCCGRALSSRPHMMCLVVVLTPHSHSLATATLRPQTVHADLCTHITCTGAHTCTKSPTRTCGHMHAARCQAARNQRGLHCREAWGQYMYV